MNFSKRRIIKAINAYMVVLPPCSKRKRNKNTLNPTSGLETKCCSPVIDLHVFKELHRTLAERKDLSLFKFRCPFPFFFFFVGLGVCQYRCTCQDAFVMRDRSRS